MIRRKKKIRQVGKENKDQKYNLKHSGKKVMINNNQYKKLLSHNNGKSSNMRINCENQRKVWCHSKNLFSPLINFVSQVGYQIDLEKSILLQQTAKHQNLQNKLNKNTEQYHVWANSILKDS